MKAICEARRAIAWTYPYGYFLIHQPKRNFYEQYQMDLQYTLETIAKVVERTNFDEFIEKDNTTGENILNQRFYDYKKIINAKYKILAEYLRNIMREIEKGFPSAPKCKKNCECKTQLLK